MKKLSWFVLFSLALSGTLDASGLAFGLFYEGIFFDNAAHFLTTMALMALAAELAHYRGKLSLGSGRQALVAGAVAGLVGGAVWEVVEIGADLLLPVFIYNPPLDSISDMAFGTLGGAVGAWRTRAYLERTSRRQAGS